MAKGSVIQKQRANGMTWIFLFQTTRSSDGKRVENTKAIGLVKDIGTSEAAAWREVGRLGLDIKTNSTSKQTTFGDLAEHFRNLELRKLRGLRVKAEETVSTHEILLDRWILPRWGETLLTDIKSLAIEAWFESLTKPGGLNWPSVVKIKSIMNQIFTHAQRHELIHRTGWATEQSSTAGSYGISKRVRSHCRIPRADDHHSRRTRLSRDPAGMDSGPSPRRDRPKTRRSFRA
jgi:hypothetical protein